MANNNHAQDRYDPPSVGSDFEQQVYGDVVKGEIFRLQPKNSAKSSVSYTHLTLPTSDLV